MTTIYGFPILSLLFAWSLPLSGFASTMTLGMSLAATAFLDFVSEDPR